MINVTKTYLPDFDEYAAILKRAWDKSWLTNNGELVRELESKLKEYLGVQHFFFTGNGTIVLQMALKALNVTKEVITTPFSYVATTNAILWEGCKPVFVDIDTGTFCIDPKKIEAAITTDTEAILATHVYGIPCDVEAIENIAARHGLKVIYDAAHAFGVLYKERSLLSYGDISTCSFHATKIFHTVEGGCIICNDEALSKKLYLQRQFGHDADDYISVGINGKNSEFHAAMGLAVFPAIAEIIRLRKNVSEIYTGLLKDHVELPDLDIASLQYNYAYYPVIFKDEKELLSVKALLQQNEINTRRYFYPSLNQLPYLAGAASCPVSENISRRVLCLPLYHDLSAAEASMIAGLVLQGILKNRNDH